MTQVTITGGREQSVTMHVVDSNYHDAKPNEKLLQFSGPVSITTILDFLQWADQELHIEGKELIIIGDPVLPWAVQPSEPV